MKAIKIGNNEQAEQNYKQQIERKRKLFNDLVEYTTQFVSLGDLEQVHTNAVQYFKKTYYERYQHDFPPLVGLDVMFQMQGCEISKIETLFRQYQSINIESWDYVKCDAPQIDFGVYARTEKQIERYKLAQSICDAVNELKATTNYTIFNGSLSQALSGIVKVSFLDTNKLIVNEDFVLIEN